MKNNNNNNNIVTSFTFPIEQAETSSREWYWPQINGHPEEFLKLK